MYVFQRTGLNAVRFFHAVHLFLIYIGHLAYTVVDVLTFQKKLAYTTIIQILYYSGALLVLPLCFLGILLTVSLSLSAYLIFARFNMQAMALPVTQAVLTQDLMPLVTGFVLCVQSSLNIISARHRITRFMKSPDEVILKFILPILAGFNLSALLLQAYVLLIIFTSLYLTFHYLLNLTVHDSLLQLGRSVNSGDLLFSMLKTGVYSSIVSLTAGYYYYQANVMHLSLRKAASRIFTRGTFWLAVSSVGWKLINF